MIYDPVIRTISRSGRDILGEGPVWSAREQALFWVDILGQKLFRMEWPACAVQQWEFSEPVGWVIERVRGGFVVGLRSGIYSLTLDPFGLELLVDPELEQPSNRLNDAKADWRGRIWFGTLDMGCDKPTGALWRLDTDLTCERVEDGLTIPNGPAISPSGSMFVHADSEARKIWRYAIDEDGRVLGKTLFLDFAGAEEAPDGMTFDSEGCLWLAQWGGARIERYSPDGKLIAAIKLPARNPTSCAFGGATLDRLFVTSAAQGDEANRAGGQLFEIETGVRGLLPFAFAG
ncbi:MAG: SMP-30/gluconolactonase/LRE family protein [Erythrobacter sp.]